MTEPTDDEILEAVKHLGAAMLSPVEVARVVLAKWGTPPAGAGEPVAWQYRSVRDKGLWFDCTEERAKSRAEHPDKWDVRYLYTAPPPQAVRQQTIQWPKTRDVGRNGDMSPDAHLRVGLDSDNDVYVSVWDEHGGGSVEFCNGGGGGGQSSRTRLALIALMVAMEADNADKPSRDWWAWCIGDTTKGGQHGAE